MGRWDRPERSDRDRERDRERRRRSRSPRRRRSRSPHESRRDRDRDRVRDKDRERDRERDPERDRSSRKSERSERKRDDRRKVEDIIGGEVNYENFDKDEQQRKLEVLMQERRERVEKWRQTQKQMNPNNGNDDSKESMEDLEEAKKTWTLEDENEDDDEDHMEQPMDLEEEDEHPIQPPPKRVEEEEASKLDIKEKKKEKKKDIKVEEKPAEEKKEEEVDDDIDPLDAYMKGIQEEVKKTRSKTVKEDQKDNKVTLMVGIAKKQVKREKGELIEQNQDALEYSSEDDAGDDELDKAMDNLQNKVKLKKVMTVTQDDITFAPFRKNFYIEVPELAKMTPQEVEALRAEMEGIKAKGKGCPKPIRTWAQCGVSKKVLDVLKR